MGERWRKVLSPTCKSKPRPSHEKMFEISLSWKPAENRWDPKIQLHFYEWHIHVSKMFQHVPTLLCAGNHVLSCFIIKHLLSHAALVLDKFDTLTLAIFTLTSRRWLHKTETSALAGCLFRKLWRNVRCSAKPAYVPQDISACSSTQILGQSSCCQSWEGKSLWCISSLVFPPQSHPDRIP